MNRIEKCELAILRDRLAKATAQADGFNAARIWSMGVLSAKLKEGLQEFFQTGETFVRFTLVADERFGAATVIEYTKNTRKYAR